MIAFQDQPKSPKRKKEKSSSPSLKCILKEVTVQKLSLGGDVTENQDKKNHASFPNCPFRSCNVDKGKS